MRVTTSVNTGPIAPVVRLGQLAPACVAALLMTVVFLRHGAEADTVIDCFVIATLVLVSKNDLVSRIIPNRVVLPAGAVVLAANTALHPSKWAEWLLASLGAGLLFLVFWRLSRGGLGMGDVKLAAFLGAALGSDVFAALIVGTTAAAFFSAAVIVRHGTEGRRRTIPLAPFLSAGAIVAVLFF
jgi:prepilin signal peptidase PulO-like enzyme (type II secretory pathway)